MRNVREVFATRRGQSQITGQQLVAAVQLIKALGGGWTNTNQVAVMQLGAQHLANSKGSAQ